MLKAIFIILSIPLILVFFWFKEGYLLGHAEGALPFYKLERYLEPTRYAWMEHPGLGNISLFTTAGKPTYIFLTFLQNNLGIPGVVIEASLLYFLIASAGIGIFLLVKEFFPKLGDKYALLSVFFYWFSPLSLTEIWNRFLLNYLFFFGALPILLLILIKGLNSKRYLYAPLLTILIGIYSYGISTLVFILLLWQMIILFTLLFFITAKNSSERWFYIKFIILVLGLFISTNCWWLTQAFSLKFLMPISQTLSNFSVSENINTLEVLSQKLGNLTDVMRFINVSSVEIIGLSWINYFNTPIGILLEFSLTSMILISIVKNRQNRSVLILGLLLFIIIFLMKGITTPLGEIYKVLFTNFSFLQVFRNPFEKFSFMLNLNIALLLGYSVFTLSAYISNKTKHTIYSSFLYSFVFFLMMILSFPFFSSMVFTNNEPPSNNPEIGYKVKIPEYYKQASDFMESKGGNFRFIGFPIGNEGITYKWERGYSGVDLSSTLFATPGILFNTVVPYYESVVPQLEDMFLKEEENFFSIANSLNARFLIYRDDIDWQERSLKNPEIILKRMTELEKKRLIRKVGDYGSLKLWENLAWKDNTFIASDKIISLLPENIISYNRIPKISNSEITIQGLPNEITNSNLLTKIIVNAIRQPNPNNLDSESYFIDIPRESNYEIFFENISPYNPKTLIERKIIFIDNKLLQNLDPIYLNPGRHQVVVNTIEEDNSINTAKGSTYTDNGAYFNNFEIENFDPISNYKVYLGNLPSTLQDITVSMFHDNSKIRNSKKISPFIKQLPFSTLNPTTLNNLNPINILFPALPSATTASISFLSNKPLNFSSINGVAVKKVIKPQPYLINALPNTPSSHTPKLTYQKVNPTKYLVHVTNASSTFMLVFSELFNNKWEAFYENNTAIYPHIRANAYANAWLVNKRGNFDITIEFTPQRLYRVGEMISLGSHLINILVLAFLIFRQKREY